jgi:hypothetical protein
MFWGEIYGILINAYVEYMLASILNLYCSKDDPDNNKFNDVYVVIMLSILIVIIPLSTIYVMMQSKETRLDPEFD